MLVCLQGLAHTLPGVVYRNWTFQMSVGTKEPDERERNNPIETEASQSGSLGNLGQPARVLTPPGSQPWASLGWRLGAVGTALYWQHLLYCGYFYLCQAVVYLYCSGSS